MSGAGAERVVSVSPDAVPVPAVDLGGGVLACVAQCDKAGPRLLLSIGEGPTSQLVDLPVTRGMAAGLRALADDVAPCEPPAPAIRAEG